MKYCDVCRYPLRESVCRYCADENEFQARQAGIRKNNLIWSLGGLKVYEEYTSEKFIVSAVNKKAFEAFNFFIPVETNIYIWSSGNGTGKTHLAAIALRRALSLGTSGRLIKPTDIFRTIRSCENAKEETSELDKLSDLDVLVLDDLDSAKDSQFAQQTLYDIIDRRYMRGMAGLIITANSSLRQLENRWGNGRIVSRLVELCGAGVFDLSCEPDHRRCAGGGLKVHE